MNYQLAVGAGVIGVGVFLWSRKGAKTSVIDKAREEGIMSKRFPQLESGLAAALENNDQLLEIVDRLEPYASFDLEAYEMFLETAGNTAEFLARRHEITLLRSMPLWFRGFVREMMDEMRRIRGAIREAEPQRLEAFDEIRNDLMAFRKEHNTNIWYDAHPGV